MLIQSNVLVQRSLIARNKKGLGTKTFTTLLPSLHLLKWCTRMMLEYYFNRVHLSRVSKTLVAMNLNWFLPEDMFFPAHHLYMLLQLSGDYAPQYCHFYVLSNGHISKLIFRGSTSNEFGKLDQRAGTHAVPWFFKAKSLLTTAMVSYTYYLLHYEFNSR